MEERDPKALSKDESATKETDPLDKQIPSASGDESGNLSARRENTGHHAKAKSRILESNEPGNDSEDAPVAKRLKADSSIPPPQYTETPTELKTPAIATESSSTRQSAALKESNDDVPMAHVHQQHNSSGSLSSDLSSASAASGERHGAMSPIPTMYSQGIPPAPPSTPATQTSTFSWDLGPATPLPFQAEVLNARQLEKQHLMMEGAATPAPTRTPAAGHATAETSKPPALPEDFSEWAVGDRYKMMRILGRGSYGEVAQAVDLYAGRPDAYVAIKRIQSPFDQEVDAIRLYREMHILRRMRGHQCIIQLVDVVQPPTDDLDDFHDLYLVFEYVDTDLYKLIMSPQYLTTEHIQTFLYQMLIALKYIHSFSVIHRDIKPANVLINEDCSLKICDFGLARIVDSYPMPSPPGKDKEDQNSSSGSDSIPPPKLGLTRQLTKHVVTRWYRAPELILIQDYNSAVDIWSLGCILGELLSMQEGNVPGYQDRKPLFPGGTCYPLSGEGDNLKKDERLDQLSVIFNVIGSPSAEDLSTIGKASQYIESLGVIQGKPFNELFPTSSLAALDLLSKMLQFNPARRLTAEEALEHEFFKTIRQPGLEVSADGPLRGPDFLESDKVDLKLLKQMIYEEVLWYHDQGASPQAVAKADEPNTCS